jgi:DNA ligase 1
MAITAPMLAGTLPPDQDPAFPVQASPKIDGIRALKVGGKVQSRTFKPIPNKYIRERLERLLPDGADGEILFGDTFQACTSMVMSVDKVPDGPVTYFMFDYVKSDVRRPYVERMADMRAFFGGADSVAEDRVKVVPLYSVAIETTDELQAFEEHVLGEGYEGVMVRKPDGAYKCGRSTLREGLLLKIKRFSDDEAVVIGAEELLHNENETTQDAFGRSKRSSHQDNKRPAGVLGALVVRSKAGVEFKIGTGFSADDRKALWQRRQSLVGQWVKYKYLEVSVKTAPRHPVFLGFRDPMDF